VFGATDEVIAIEKLGLVGEDGMVPRWCAESIFNPCLLFGER
jgi:hypothetical protein